MKRFLVIFLSILSVQVVSAQFTYEVINYDTHPEWKDMAAAMYDNILSNAIVDDQSGLYYHCILDVPDVSKQDLMSRARIYFTENYGRGDKVIDLDDENAGVIIAKSIDHIVRVDVKDSKARITARPIISVRIDNFINKKGKFRGSIASYYWGTHSSCLLVITSLQQYLLNCDNW